MGPRLLQFSLALAALCAPRIASAHFFATSYSLPIPFSLYAYAASATLVVSFALVGVFVKASPITRHSNTQQLLEKHTTAMPLNSTLVGALRFLGLVGLTMTIATGLIGNQNSSANFSMPFFWIGFTLGFTYLTAIVGDVYSLINPWRTLCEWFERARPGTFVPRVRYSPKLAYWPALLLYFLFIWVELFGHTRPRSLALLLSVYTVITLACAWVFGQDAWFRYGEFFGVFLRLVAKMAPLTVTRDAHGQPRIEIRRPFTGLRYEPAEHQSLVVFVVFMLSSTAFDGIHETLPFVGMFWRALYPLLHPAISAFSDRPYVIAPDLFYIWQWTMLAVLGAVYYGIYLLFMWLAKAITRSSMPVGELALRFAFTLIPIAFVYHVTHYFTLLITQAPTLLMILSDPFGVGWNLLGMRDIDMSPVIPNAGFIWHTQIWLILAGHIVSVYLSHREALRIFGDSRRAVLSQIPMLLLMVFFTTLGLWILSLPIAPITTSLPLGTSN